MTKIAFGSLYSTNQYRVYASKGTIAGDPIEAKIEVDYENGTSELMPETVMIFKAYGLDDAEIAVWNEAFNKMLRIFLSLGCAAERANQ